MPKPLFSVFALGSDDNRKQDVAPQRESGPVRQNHKLLVTGFSRGEYGLNGLNPVILSHGA